MLVTFSASYGVQRGLLNLPNVNFEYNCFEDTLPFTGADLEVQLYHYAMECKLITDMPK